MQNSNQPSPPRRGRSPSQPTSSTAAESAAHASSQPSPAASPEEEIARRAHARWENSDRAHGRDQEHWFAAEEELRQSPNDPNRGQGAGAA